MIQRKELETEREIERFPTCPHLTTEEVNLITRTVFVPSSPQQADVLFVFGSSYGEWRQVAELYKKGLSPVVYIAGGVEDRETPETVVSHRIRDALVHFGVSMNSIVVDEQSGNTKEDAVFGREIFLKRNIAHKRILFACKAPHSGRCLKTLKKVFPDSELFPFVYDFVFRGTTVTERVSKTWWQSDLGRSYVYGEYRRIQVYSERGDI